MQTPPGSEPGESAGPSPGPKAKRVTKKPKQRSRVITLRVRMAASPGLFPFIQKEKTNVFGQESHSSQQGSEEQQHQVGRAPPALQAALRWQRQVPGALSAWATVGGLLPASLALGVGEVSLGCGGWGRPAGPSLGEGVCWQSGSGGLCVDLEAWEHCPPPRRGDTCVRLAQPGGPHPPNTSPESSALRMAEKLLHQ